MRVCGVRADGDICGAGARRGCNRKCRSRRPRPDLADSAAAGDGPVQGLQGSVHPRGGGADAAGRVQRAQAGNHGVRDGRDSARGAEEDREGKVRPGDCIWAAVNHIQGDDSGAGRGCRTF